MNFYNDNDPKICAWLEELVRRSLIPPGDVVCKSITEIKADELKSYIQCHFFAGIGGWPYALQLAGWPADRPVWTGSCPCQPFSAAGKGKGQSDERHLWPYFFRLIRESKPECVFGEQVAGAVGFGWLDGVCADLEAEGYAVGAVVLGAHSVGAPHIRQRLYWVASNSNNDYANGRSGIMQMRRQRSQAKAAPDLQRKGIEWATESRPLALAYGISERVAKLNGFGNAIVPQVAAEFIEAYLTL